MSRRLAVTMMLAGSLVLGACGDDDGDDNTEETRDTGVRNDATVPDAARDAARDADADTEEDIDAGPDSAVPDAGEPQDAAPPIDATTPLDATAPVDANTPIDAAASAVTPNAAGQLVITEIMATPVGYADDGLAEWVEVYNPSTTVTYNLGGCVFSDKVGDTDYTIPSPRLIPPGGYLVLASAVFTVPANGFVGDVVYAGPNSTGLSSSADSPEIKCGTVQIDTVNYGAQGFTAPSTMQGRTIQLSSGSLNATANDTGSNWCFGTSAYFTSDAGVNYGTPKAANRACP